MPYVNIEITREGATPEQKAKLIEGVTGLPANALGKSPATKVVVIDEVDTELGYRWRNRHPTAETRPVNAENL